VFARTNRCYNERGSRTNYVRSSILCCMLLCLLEYTASTDVPNENYRSQCNGTVISYSWIFIFHFFFDGNNLGSILPVRMARGPFVWRMVCVVTCGAKIHGVSSVSLSPPPTSPHAWGSVLILILLYLLTAIGLTPGDSSTVHIYTQT